MNDKLNIEKETDSGFKVFVRVTAVVLSIVISLVIAVMVGIGLALWDTGKSVEDLKIAYGMQKETADYYEVPDSDNLPNDYEHSDAGNLQDKDNHADDESVMDDIQNADESDDADSQTDETFTEIQEDNISGDAEKEPEESVEPEESAEPVEGIAANDLSDNPENHNVFDGADEESDELPPIVYPDPNVNYPIPFSNVDENYFSDALFIGDSRMQGFGLWSGLPATFYTSTGFQLYRYETTKVVRTEDGKEPIFNALPYDAFTKIYIKVGLNEIGWGTEEKFESIYAQFIQQLREQEPRAIIFIHGLLPVTAQKSASDAYINNEKIIARNNALAVFAQTQNAYYLNVWDALADANGCLPAEMAGDGIHMKSQYMPLWTDYLMQHGVVR